MWQGSGIPGGTGIWQGSGIPGGIDGSPLNFPNTRSTRGEPIDERFVLCIRNLALYIGGYMGQNAKGEVPDTRFVPRGEGQPVGGEVPDTRFVPRGEGQPVGGEVPDTRFVPRGEGQLVGGEVLDVRLVPENSSTCKVQRWCIYQSTLSPKHWPKVRPWALVLSKVRPEYLANVISQTWRSNRKNG